MARSLSHQLHALRDTAVRAGAGARAVNADGITVYPLERIGNQLFQYAAGLAQARRLGCPLYAAEGFFRGRASQRPYGDYALGSFDSGMVVPAGEEFHRPVARGLPVMMAPAAWQHGPGRRFSGSVAGVFSEASFTYDPRIERVPVGTTLLGHFQSWRYFDAVAAEVRERVLRLHDPSPWYRAACEQLVPGDGSVVLNVRRGDYLLPHVQAYHGLARRSFYERSLELVRDLGAHGTVYVMSDANDAVLAEFAGLGGGVELVPLTPPPGTPSIESIALLARCDAIAIANSSFSWWGAWLGQRPGRPVVAPRPWFTTPDVDTRDLLLPEWVTLDREH